MVDQDHRLDRYGEEQTMVRNENGNWIGEDGDVFVHERKCGRYANKCLLVGFLVGAGTVLLTLLLVMGVPA